MKRTEPPIDPEIAAQLDAIDATLAGDPVDPEHAELAELALLLAAGRPQLEPEFATALDSRVQRRFAARRSEPEGADARRPRWSPAVLGGLASAAVAAVVVVVVLSSGGGRGSQQAKVISAAAAGTSTSAAASQNISKNFRRDLKKTPAARGAIPANPTNGLAPLAAVSSASASVAAAPQPPTNGRKLVQSANVALTATASHIDAVSQEVFDVVGRENGIVNSSSVTAATGGYAQFKLSIPSANLGDTMTALSRLRYARVASRTDTTQDVNGQYVSAGRRLADDRALRTSLLKRLANASTQTEINSLNAQIHDAENAIARDEAAVRSLNNRINYSQVEVTIDSGIVPVPVAHGHSSGSFTLGKAAHDAGRVLTVAAGVALITLAALVPVLLIAALGAWITATMRRRRREQALDVA